MAKYDVKFSCGHTETVNLVGKIKDRQRRIEWYEERGLCPDCWEKAREAEREVRIEKAFHYAQEMDLPELQGTEKQIRWAVQLRQAFIEQVDRFVEGGFISQEDGDLTLDYYLKNENAVWWIDNRYELKYLESLVAQAKKVQEHVPAISDKEKQELLAEATVVPENATKSGVVEIKILDDTIEAHYVKDDDFRIIVKGLGLQWDMDKRCWSRNIRLTAGTPQDRAAELGNKLLNAGFAIRIMDNETRQKAISGEFEPEHKRWIFARIKGEYEGWLAITWSGQDDDLYKKARNLPGSKWSNPSVVVKPEFYKEVEEFAELYDFRFTDKASQLIEQTKSIEGQATKIVPVAAPEEEPSKDGLAEILASEATILDDLKD